MSASYNSKEKKQLSEPGKTLSQRVARGGVWGFAYRITDSGVGLLRLIILGRLLTPNDFGLLGIALLAMAILETFSATGFHEALVQKKEDISRYLDSAWTASVIRGVFLFILLLLSSHYVALFFNSPEASLIIKVIGVSVLLKGFTNISVVCFQKELEFNKLYLYHLSGNISNFIVAIAAALIFRSVWALVFGLLAGHLVGFFMSYLIHPYRPRLCFDSEKLKELFGFGKWVLGSSALIFLLTQGDDIFVGRLLGVAALGFYQMAYKISNLPATEIDQIVSQVTFPAYSRMQDNLPRLRDAYLKVLQFTAFLSFPIGGLIFVLAPDFTGIFLGEKWMPMVPAMQALVCWGVIRSLTGAINPVFLSLGRPRTVTKLQAVQTVLMFILIYPLTVSWNILGASLAVFFSAFIMFFITNRILIKTINCKTLEFYRLIILPLSLTIIGTLPVIFIKLYGINLAGIYSFFLFVGIFVLVFILMSFVADRFLNYGIRALLRETLEKGLQ